MLPDPSSPRRTRIPDDAHEVFSGKLFRIYQWEAVLFDGSVTTFEMARRPDNVVVIAIGPDDRILVTIQEQPGLPGKFFDLPGGRVEPPERAVDAAAREMLEETGYAAENLELLFEFQASDRIDSWTSIFLGTELEHIAKPSPDKGERVETKWLSLTDVHRWALVNQRLAIAPLLLAEDVNQLRRMRRTKP